MVDSEPKVRCVLEAGAIACGRDEEEGAAGHNLDHALDRSVVACSELLPKGLCIKTWPAVVMRI